MPGMMRENLTRLLLRELSGDDSETDGTAENARPTLMDALLKDALRERATDLHLDPRSDGMIFVRLRIDGVVQDAAALTAAQGQRLINQFKTTCDLDPVVPLTPMEARRTYELDSHELDIRVVAVATIGGQKLAVRLLDPRRVEQKITSLGLRHELLVEIQHWLSNVNGMFLVSGPTGSGKTTTLYALLRELRLVNRNTVTIEEPVEYQMDGVTQMQVNEEHGLTFAEGVKTMLRLDPDYLLVGEIRDAESGRAAVDAAASGRVLLSTLHSRDAIGAVTKLRNWDLEDHEICATLAVAVAQRLVRELCPDCRRQETPTSKELQWLRALGISPPEQTWHPVGCEACEDLGYRGRTGIFEVWRMNEEDYESILAHTDERTLRRRLAERGHGFLLNDALAKARSGVTSLDELRTMGGFGPAGPGTLRDEGFRDRNAEHETGRQGSDAGEA